MRGLVWILLFMAVVILLQRWQATRRARHEASRQAHEQARMTAVLGEKATRADVIDLSPCPVCQTYIDQSTPTFPYCCSACQQKAKRR